MTKSNICQSIHKANGNWYYCQLKKGHKGNHKHVFRWDF